MERMNYAMIPNEVKKYYQNRKPLEDNFRIRRDWLGSHMDQRLVTNYYGIGGIGKTWYLNYSLKPMVKACERACFSYTFLDVPVPYEIDLVCSLASQIGKHYGYYYREATRAILSALKKPDSILDQDTTAQKTVLGALDNMISTKKFITDYVEKNSSCRSEKRSN